MFAALLANLGIAIAKFVGFFFTLSSSMLAEGVHSLADTGNQLLLLLGGHRAKKEPTPVHPFGFGRERYFWAFVVSIVLFALGSVFAIFEGVEKLLHHELESPQWAIGILLIAIVLGPGRSGPRSRPTRCGGASWAEFIRRSKAPELPCCIEDSGALIGLVIALVAIGLSVITGSGMWDGVGSTLIGLLLGVIAVVLATEMKSLLIGESASDADQRAIVDAIEGDPQVRSLIHLRTEHIGPEELLVGPRSTRPALTMRELAGASTGSRRLSAGGADGRVIYPSPTSPARPRIPGIPGIRSPRRPRRRGLSRLDWLS